ncbi:hypothetical protein [Actinacidiphila paucisporea]|uniref:hypothetical protein n=1 Tax=Actinacidiphila paucisporea TaxID=310782 RepID=UPI000937DF05|nr:hypothetical protein [Actinacidiphila paucisporea]
MELLRPGPAGFRRPPCRPRLAAELGRKSSTPGFCSSGAEPTRGEAGRSARRGKPSSTDQESAAELYEQLAFDVAGDAGQDQEHGQEQEFVISPGWQARLEELKRRVGELGREAPKPKAKKKGCGGTAGAPPQRPGYRPRR